MGGGDSPVASHLPVVIQPPLPPTYIRPVYKNEETREYCGKTSDDGPYFKTFEFSILVTPQFFFIVVSKYFRINLVMATRPFFYAPRDVEKKPR